LVETRRSGIVRFLIVDGSFVTGKPAPNDIDLMVVVAPDHDFDSELAPTAYDVVSRHRVHRKYGFDMFVAREDSTEYRRWTEFFQQVRLEPGRKKGILKLML
jgi:predicted nucleotidyltransferase